MTELLNKAIALAASMGVDFAELGLEARKGWMDLAKTC
jgi:hypothetical protein